MAPKIGRCRRCGDEIRQIQLPYPEGKAWWSDNSPRHMFCDASPHKIHAPQIRIEPVSAHIAAGSIADAQGKFTAKHCESCGALTSVIAGPDKVAWCGSCTQERHLRERRR